MRLPVGAQPRCILPPAGAGCVYAVLCNRHGCARSLPPSLFTLCGSRAREAVTVVELLCSRGGARVDARDSIAGDTPLHAAARCGDRAVVSAMLRLGSLDACSVVNEAGDDPVSTAVRSGHDDLARSLRWTLSTRRRLWMVRLCVLLSWGRAECVAGPPSPVLIVELPAPASGGGDEGVDDSLREAIAAKLAAAAARSPRTVDADAAFDDPSPPEALQPHPALPVTEVFPWPPSLPEGGAPPPLPEGGALPPLPPAPSPDGGAASSTAASSSAASRRPMRPRANRLRFTATTDTVAHLIAAFSKLPPPLFRRLVEML